MIHYLDMFSIHELIIILYILLAEIKIYYTKYIDNVLF